VGGGLASTTAECNFSGGSRNTYVATNVIRIRKYKRLFVNGGQWNDVAVIGVRNDSTVAQWNDVAVTSYTQLTT
jgi:hypothetical protein